MKTKVQKAGWCDRNCPYWAGIPAAKCRKIRGGCISFRMAQAEKREGMGFQTIHFIAQCLDCDWRTEDYIEGAIQASWHHRKTGHAIACDRGQVYTYPRRK